jgi:DNA-directed RNA polymerase sigma subunit (sigma70/sigma32)
MIRTTEVHVSGKRPRRPIGAEACRSRREVGRVGPLPTRLRAAPEGDARPNHQLARERMLRAALPELIEIARRYEHLGLSLLDLLQAGSIGYMKACQPFDPDDANPSHDCLRSAEQSICRALACQVHTFRFPSLGAGRNRTTAPANKTKTSHPTVKQAATPRDFRAGSHTLR